MERILYIDCFSGASGDMLLGACLDAGVPLDVVRDAIGGLGLDGVDVRVERVRRAGITAAKAIVVDPAADGGAIAASGSPQAGDAGAARKPHRHRHLPEILRLIGRARLSDAARAKADALFRRLAEAEAAVHGIAIEKVHFHEVGAIDSIVDILGTVCALDWLKPDRVVASPLNTGSGTVRCDHGVMPVPAPATARLIEGVPVFADGPATELLTPTGALLVTGHATAYGPLPPMAIEKVGYGAGDRDFPDRANVLRVVVGTAALVERSPSESDAAAGQAQRATTGADRERLHVLECEVDDLNPQVFGTLMARLLTAGARDVFYTAVQMKKDRPGTLVTVLADPARADALLDILFAETTTIGVRMHEVVREALPRETVTVHTPYGDVAVKLARRHGRIVNAAPEFDDCSRLAAERGVPVKEVLAAALQAWRTGPQ
jgi:uncharacterized protein (TIGR00299 family) protein